MSVSSGNLEPFARQNENCWCVLQSVEVALLICLLLLFEDLDVFMGFAFVWAEEQEIGFSRTLGIRNHDVCRDGRFHDDSTLLLLRDGRPSTFDAVIG